ncbi:MAG: polysaccharide deacetylase family protein [Parabacteroides gordonii]|nr:polysaccharide deacetylase family protein [Parabacteroides gordonii]
MGWLVFIAVLSGIGAFLFYASYSIRSGVYVKALCRENTDKRVVCLTFDDGPDPRYTPEVLDVLKKYQVQAAFFLHRGEGTRKPCRDGAHRIGRASCR